MSDVRRVVPISEFEPLLQRWASLDWQWDRPFLDQLLAEWGWHIEAQAPGILRVRTDLPHADVAIINLDENNELRSLSVFATATLPINEWADANAKAFVRDAFVDVVEGVTTVLGQPTDRLPGDEPEVRWTLNGATLAVGAGPSTVELSVLSPAQVEKQAREAELRFDDGDDDDS